MYSNLIIFCLILSGFNLAGQHRPMLDSLLKEAQHATSDSSRAAYHYELCYLWAVYNFDSAMFHATKIADIAKTSGDQRIRYQTFNAMGLVFDYSSQVDSAIHFYDLAGSG